MNFRVSISLLLGAVAAAAQSGSTVEGRVLSTVQNQPVAKAVVTLRADVAGGRAGRGVALNVPAGRGGPVADVWVAESQADGRYKLAGVPPGNYTIRANRPGYLTQPPGRFATAAEIPPVKVQAGQNLTGVDMRITPTAAVAGRVIDTDGDPVRGGMIQLMHYVWVQGKKKLQPAEGGQIDDRGEYRIFDAPPGSYFVRAMPMEGRQMGMGRPGMNGFAAATGLSSAYYPDTNDAARATELYLSPGAELRNIEIRVRPISLHRIRGTYPYDADSNVQVQALNQDGEGFGGMMPMNVVGAVGNIIQSEIVRIAVSQSMPQTPAAGTFEIDNLQPGTYTVLANQFKRGKNQDGANLQARQVVQVLDRDVDGIALTFAPPVKITATLQIEGEAPKNAGANQLFLVSDEVGAPGGMSKPKPDGTVEWTVSPGKYRLRVTNSQAEYLKSLKIDGKELADKNIDTGKLNGPVKIVVSTQFGTVEGTVTDADGKPVYNADMTLIPDQSQEDWFDRFRSVLTDTRGHFQFSAVAPGEYRAYAWVGVESGAPQSAEFRKPFESQAVVVKVGPGENPALDVKAIH